MAQPRKLVAANTGTRAPVAPAATGSDANWLRATLSFFVLFCVVGVIPAALGGEVFGYWRLPTTGVQLGAAPWSLTYDAPLATPAPVFANATMRIVTAPGGSTVIATLEPGFSLNVTRYATRAGVRWAQVKWAGPTQAAGGSGWAPASQFVTSASANTAAQARDIGDMGALSPAFGQTVSALGTGFSSALYFSTNQSYHTANIDQAEPLGAQIVPIVLTLLYAKGIVAAQPNASNSPPPIARDLASGNAQALTFDYALVGDAQGIDSFLAQHSISGFQFAAHAPSAAKGTARSLSLFYTALTNSNIVSPHDSAEIISLLASANASAATAITPQTMIGSGALTVTTGDSDGGVVTIAAGSLKPANGPSVVVVAIAQGATAAATQKTLQTFFGQLIALMQG